MKKLIAGFIGLVLFCSRLSAQEPIINMGNLLLHSNAEITFFGDFSNNGVFTDYSKVCIFIHSGNQVISGSQPISFRHLKLKNPNGIIMQAPIEIRDTLSLVDGVLNLNSNMLTIINSSPDAIIRTNGYILSENTDNSGKVKWNIGDNQHMYEFPFGTETGDYIPFKFTLTDGNVGNVTVSTYHTNADNTPFPNTPDVVSDINDMEGNDNSANTVDRFWQIDHDGTGGIATLTFTCSADETSDITDLHALRWNSITKGWEIPPGTQTATLNSVTIGGINEFSPWTLEGINSQNNDPLPICLIDFEASKNGNYVNVNWTTSSETNNDFFSIEKTVDFNDFETVGILKGAGNSNQRTDYKMVDYYPYYGISYYRLKQTNFDGSSKYSDFKYVLFDNDLSNLLIFPNPTYSSNINIDFTSNESTILQLNVSNIMGVEDYKTTFNIEKGRNLFKLEKTNNIKAGLNTFSFIVNGKQIIKKVMIY